MAYDPDFLSIEVPLPTLSLALTEAAFGGGAVIDHSRYSVIFHRLRGLAIVTAHNIDGADLLPEGTIERRDRFRLDPNIPAELQIDNDRGYLNNPWDRGHLVRRRSLHWGDPAAAAEADLESFFWSNIAPQHERLHDTAWGSIEDWMLERAEQDARKVCVMTGPVFGDDDPIVTNAAGEDPFRLPAGFWKVMVIPHDGGHRLASFVTWQRDHDRPDPVTYDPVLEQVRLTTVEMLTGLSFVPLRSLDPLRTEPMVRGRPRAGAPTGPEADPVLRIFDSSDIVL